MMFGRSFRLLCQGNAPLTFVFIRPFHSIMVFEVTLLIMSRGYATDDFLENSSTKPVPWKASFCHPSGMPKYFLPKSLVFFYAVIHCHPETGKHDADEPMDPSALMNIRVPYVSHPPVLEPAA